MSNSAQYGSNIGSFPVKIVLKDSSETNYTIFDVPSGLILENTSISFDLVDSEGQKMNLINEGTIKIVPVTIIASVASTDYAKINNGTVMFDNMIFKAKAGYLNAQYKLTTKAIDSQISSLVQSNSGNAYNTYIDVSFRY